MSYFGLQTVVNKKAGPFDMVICTGVFFNDEPEGDGIESSDAIAWTNIKNGKVYYLLTIEARRLRILISFLVRILLTIEAR